MNLLSDLRYAARALFSRPAFTIVAVLTLALGIGANTAVFSVVHGLLLSPLPYADGERLVQVYNTYPGIGLENAGTSIPDYLDRKEQADALEDLFIYTSSNFNLSDAGAPEHVQAVVASPSLFSTLQVQPALGRAFTEDEAVIGRHRVAVLSHGLWQSRFGGASDVVGRSIRLDGVDYAVLGVMPQGFGFPTTDMDLWVPFAFTDAQRSINERGREFSESVGRLAPGATIAQLNAQMDAIVQRNLQGVAGTEAGANAARFYASSGFTGRARTLRAQWVGDLPRTLAMLQGVVAFVLLIACANVTNLQLARLSGRGRELAVRAALGAGLHRIAGLLVCEAMLLAALGATLGLLLAWGGIALMGRLGLGLAARGMEVSLHGPVLLFALGVALFAGLVCGLLPLLSLARGRLFTGLRDGGRSGGTMTSRLRVGLVVAQTALAVALLVGAGLMLRSFASLLDVDTGFRSEGVISARLALPDERYPDDPAQERFYSRVLAELRAVPGVEEATLISAQPFGGNGSTQSYSWEGRTAAEGQAAPHTHFRVVDERYFQALGIPQLQGRGFEPGDHAGTTPVAVVDRLLAEKHFPDGNAVGQRIAFDTTPDADTEWITIAGVVGTVRNFDLAEPLEKETVYMSYRQQPLGESDLIVRTSLDPAALVGPLRDAVLRVDPEIPLFDVRTLDQRIAESMNGTRAPMVLLAVFAAVALLLAVIGLYGVLSFVVSQRRREIGVRMALGAGTRDVQRLVLRQGGLLAAIGLALGVVIALALGRLIASQLHGVGAADVATLAGVTLLLAATSLLATWVPARRAAQVDPQIALRQD